MNLREYQTTALKQIKSSFKAGYKAPLLVLPTGAGKTIVFSELSKYLIDQGKKVLILVHRRELVTQACSKLDEINTKYGVIAPSYKSTKDPLQVASVYTLSRRMHKLNYTPDYIIFDEAHHVAAKTWIEVVNKYKKAIRIGVTATPIRLDNKPLGAYFDVLIKGPEVKDLVEQGYLCSHKVYASPSQLDFSKLKLKRNDYLKKDISKIMKDPVIVGNAIQHYKKYLLNKPTVVFCVDIPHAQTIFERFLQESIKVALLTGDTPQTERDQILNNLRDHIIHVVVSIDVISEGTDLPCVEGAILLRPTNSESLYRQQVGRVLRPAKGKTAIVLDHVNNTINHGFIDDHRDWQLTEEEDEIEVKKLTRPSIRICKQCGHVFELQKACPACGFEITKKELIEIEGQLEELRKTRAKLIKNSLVTLKKGFEDSIYSDKKFDKNNKLQLKTNQKIIFKNINGQADRLGLIGDNVLFYERVSNPIGGVVIGFKDDGYYDEYEEYFLLPEIPKKYKDQGYDSYWFPEHLQPGMKIKFPIYNHEKFDLSHCFDREAMQKDLKKMNRESWELSRDEKMQYITKHQEEIELIRSQTHPKVFDLKKCPLFYGDYADYTYLQCNRKDQDKFISIRVSPKIFCHLDRRKHIKRTYLGKKHRGYSTVLLTSKGIKFHGGRQKYSEKNRKKIINFKGNKDLLLNQFIGIARKNGFKAGYNIDWAYQNVYARQLIQDMNNCNHKQK